LPWFVSCPFICIILHGCFTVSINTFGVEFDVDGSGGEREGGGRFGGAEEWAADDLVERFVGASNEALQTSIARRHALPTLLSIDAAVVSVLLCVQLCLVWFFALH
jgi:hypothetical protein